MVLLHLYLKGRQYPQYRKRWKEHFGIFDAPNVERTIWVHAVSVGEALAAIPIIKRIQIERPELSIVVTTTTPTGADRVQSMLGESVLHLYSPYDLPWVVKRFIRKIKPRLTVIMETELWPNFVYYSRKQDVPVVVVNARLSARSALNYARIPIPTNRLLLQPITEFACQSAGDAQRFIQLGASPDKVKVTGSVKFDIQPPHQLDSQTREIFAPWLDAPFVWVAGSTHVGEDEIVLQAHRLLLDAGVEAKLILVPRHPERFDSVAELIEQRGFVFARRSISNSPSRETEVFLCDSMGEMMYCYNAGHVAFVGGSLIERGGHNPLEPASLSKPVLTGKYTFNFSDVFRNMIDAGAVKIVDEHTLSEVLMQLHQDEVTH
jgi:3-deoxy-D-manno-octulosonic-acid transferase